jgi:sec-independent protein translocase protein TatA
MGLFDSWEKLLLVLVVLILLFGSAKLPKAAKSMGEAMRIFKKEAQKLHDDDSASAPKVQATTAEQLPNSSPVVTQPQAQPTAPPAAAPPPEAQQTTNQPG